VLKIIPLKIATYRVSPMTKVRIIIEENVTKTFLFLQIKMILRPQKDLLGIEEYSFTIFDGIQPKLTLSMCASKARTLLALYFHFLRKRLGKNIIC
jgi:hypothetical protein